MSRRFVTIYNGVLSAADMYGLTAADDRCELMWLERLDRVALEL
jgi:hypothetical protein